MIAFIQRIEGIGFSDALHLLVERYNIELPERIYKNQIRLAIREAEKAGEIERAIELAGELE